MLALLEAIFDGFWLNDWLKNTIGLDVVWVKVIETSFVIVWSAIIIFGIAPALNNALTGDPDLTMNPSPRVQAGVGALLYVAKNIWTQIH